LAGLNELKKLNQRGGSLVRDVSPLAGVKGLGILL
jgi:hypothetical protein